MLRITFPAKVSITSTVLLPNAETNRRFRFTSAVMWSSRPATWGTGICSSSCSGKILSPDVCCIASDFSPLIARNNTAQHPTTAIANAFFISSPQYKFTHISAPAAETAPRTGYSASALRLRLVNQNCGAFSVVCRCSHIIPIQFRRPEGRPCPRPGRQLRDFGVMVRISLLVHINRAHIESAPPRNINTVASRVKINAVHSVHGRKRSYFLPSLGIYRDHFRRSVRPDKQPVVEFIKRRVAWPLARHRPLRHNLARLCIGNLDLIRRRNQCDQCPPRFVQQQFGGMGVYSYVANFRIAVCVDHRYFSIIFSGVFAAISHIENLRVRIIRYAIGSRFELYAVQKFKSVATENPHHPVITAGHEELID